MLNIKNIIKTWNKSFLINLTSIKLNNLDLKHFCSGAKFEFDTRRVTFVFNKWREKFENSGISEPEQSIKLILAHILGTKSICDVLENKNKIFTQLELNKIELMCEKRLQNCPIQYIINEWDFRSLTLKMRRPVFIPRPETEQLIDIINLEIPKNQSKEILELCCGSGAISLALLNENPEIKMIAIDQSKIACMLTELNAKQLHLDNRLRVIQGQINSSAALDFDSVIKNKMFNLIVCNPPYVPAGDLAYLQPEIKLYEDLGALDGGEDGLEIIKLILKVSTNSLNENGTLFLEVDPLHPDKLRDFLRQRNDLGLSLSHIHKDCFGSDRFVEIAKVQ